MCPLCLNEHISFYHSDKKRDYYQCKQCNLVFVAEQFLPSPEREKAEYELHQNHFDDAGYVRYLSRVLPHIENIVAASGNGLHALDFGCGPSPVLASLLSDKFNVTRYYDPLYFPNRQVVNNARYHVITCTEAIEHFHKPHREWNLLVNMLSEHGKLVIMTKRLLSKERFAQWHYKNDPTHVCFFSESTFDYLAQTYNLQVSFPDKDIAVFRKS